MSVRLARRPVLAKLVSSAHLLNADNEGFIAFCRTHDIEWADAAEHIPLPDNSADVVYASHMLEHLDRAEAQRFLDESKRVLAGGGVLRLAVPDLKMIIAKYQQSGNADRFMDNMYLGRRSHSWRDKLEFLVAGDRGHQWMYDGPSLVRLLTAAGFSGAKVLPPGVTTIPDAAPLNLHERADESVYVEARKQ
jgi:predicted SAM-dependent methyltransferase